MLAGTICTCAVSLAGVVIAAILKSRWNGNSNYAKATEFIEVKTKLSNLTARVDEISNKQHQRWSALYKRLDQHLGTKQ